MCKKSINNIEDEKMKKVMLVFGTRPEAIKMAPLVKAFQKESDKFQTIVCVTGQHREMLDQVLAIFDIKPDYDLNIMKQGQDLYDVTSRVLLGMRDVLKKVRPDIVLVHGDTTTSTASALAAFYQQIPVGHVEAGLRTHNIYSPWPEEMNRQITGRIATYHFSPTPLSRQNLLAEGLREEAVMVTGNTVIDALYMVVDKIKSDKILDAKLEDTLNQAGYNVNRLSNGKKLVLITGHRRENFGDGFISMCTAIKDLAQKYPDVDFSLEDYKKETDLVIYFANMKVGSNQTTIRITWDDFLGESSPKYVCDLPSLFLSFSNPYHLVDVPMVRTYINAYTCNATTVYAMVEKLMGRSEFKGISPVDPFAGLWDTKL